MSDLNVESAVSAFDGSPFVVMRWNQESGQLTPDEARTLGLHIIGAADAADSDAHLCTALGGMGLEQELQAAVLLLVRSARDEAGQS